MELRHLRAVAAVAEHRHLTRAAAALGVSQQALSEQIKDAERELGVGLFVRHARGMTATRVGAEFAAHARDVLAAHAKAVAHVRRPGADRQVLRVGLLECGTIQFLWERARSAFRTAYPHVAVAVDPRPVRAQGRAVRDGEIDVGFYRGALPSELAEAPEVAATPVLPDAFGTALLAAADPRAAAAAVDPAALADVPLVHVPARVGAPATRQMLAVLAERGAVGRAAVEEPDPVRIHTLVRAEVGWAVVPDTVRGAAPRGTVTRPIAGGPLARFDLRALTRARGAEGDPGGRDPLAEAFLECLRRERDRAAGAEPAASATA